MASNEVEVLDPTATVEKLQETAAARAVDRRNFIAALGMTGAAGLLAGCSTTASPAPGPTPIGQTDVLNFALNLEYLEATFYSFIVQGVDLPASVLGGSGAVTNAPAKITFASSQIQDMLNEIYFDEINHVIDLRSILGVNAVTRPAINLGAAGAITGTNALSVARQFEDVGATAYAGAASLLMDSNLTYAAQILAVEGFHAGALRLVSIQNPSIAAYAQADSLDVRPADPGAAALAASGPGASGGFFATAGNTNATAAFPNGFAFTRTTSQVLAIVYGGASSGASSGGFFPNGVNGRIKTV